MSKQETKTRERERTPNNLTTTGYRNSDELWAVLEPLLPAHVTTHHFGEGRPRVPDRTCADAISMHLRSCVICFCLVGGREVWQVPFGGTRDVAREGYNHA